MSTKFKNRQEKKLAMLDSLLSDGKMTKAQYDEAVRLEKAFNPYILKYYTNGKVKKVLDIFKKLQAEREAKLSKKRKKSAK